MVGAPVYTEIQGNPEVDLPASGTEVQPPELGSAPLNNDDMATIQQRDEGQEAEGASGPAATEENKNNEE